MSVDTIQSSGSANLLAEERQGFSASAGDSSCSVCQHCCQATYPKAVLSTQSSCNVYSSCQGRKRQNSQTSNDSGIQVTTPPLQTIDEGPNQDNCRGGGHVYETRILGPGDESLGNQNSNNTARTHCNSSINVETSVPLLNNREVRHDRVINCLNDCSETHLTGQNNGRAVCKQLYSENRFSDVKDSARNDSIVTKSDGLCREFTGTSKENWKRKMNHCAFKKCCYACYLFLLLLIIAAIPFVVITKIQMEKRIASLEKAINEQSNAPSFSGFKQAALPPKDSFSRAYIHLSLKSEKHVPHTPWGQRVLQWNTVTLPSEKLDSGNQLEYNSEKRSLIVREAGTYFVYNQIYVYRHLKIAPVSRSVSNQTLFHAILKRPFNFPSDKTPMTISESTLSNCWHEKANTQIHSSYQGIIVELQIGDEILVALQDYDDSIDTLDPKSTSFGAFKL